MAPLLLPHYARPSPLYVNDLDTLLARCDVRAVAELVYDYFVCHRRWSAKAFRLGHLVAAVEAVYVQLETEYAWSVDYAETYLGYSVATRQEITAVCLHSLLRSGWVAVKSNVVPHLVVDKAGTLSLKGYFYAHRDLISAMRARHVG